MKVDLRVHSMESPPLQEPWARHWIEIQELIFPILITLTTRDQPQDPSFLTRTSQGVDPFLKLLQDFL